jgi:hypothetical protein
MTRAYRTPQAGARVGTYAILPWLSPWNKSKCRTRRLVADRHIAAAVRGMMTP